MWYGLAMSYRHLTAFTVAVCVCLAVVAVACKSEPAPEAAPPAEEAKPEPAAPAQPPPAAAAKEAGPSVSEPSFDLTLATAGNYKAGELGRVVLTLTPKGIYHVNQDYPISISLKAPAEVSLPKASLEKSDAAEFGEKVAKFDVPLTPSKAGEHTLLADVDFAVCTEETCVPDQRKLALKLAVE